MRTSPDKWAPQGVGELEPNALKAVKSENSAYIIAGPGAGKTEVLAQRAAYLLQTGVSPPPKNILAICFKRDAARNLQDRVLQRCGPVLTRRFHSYTFDGLSKSLLDRFRLALPEAWRPEKSYKIRSEDRFKELESFLRSLDPPAELGTKLKLGGVDGRKFHNNALVGIRLPETIKTTKNLYWWASLQVWHYRLHTVIDSELTFAMIGRLSELLLRTNPKILAALRLTYSHVLLDEFQDTTLIQYHFLQTAFEKTSIPLTAVGDHRQRIMGWAMAMEDAFSPFEKDFGADNFKLTMNYRSSPDLVKIQHRLMKAIDPDSAEAVSYKDTSEGVCEIWNFATEVVEAQTLSAHIKKLIEGGIRPRDIAVLVKHSPAKYAKVLIEHLAANAVEARVENDLQDLLAEPLSEGFIAILRSATNPSDFKAWDDGLSLLAEMRGISQEDPAWRGLEVELEALAKNLRNSLAKSKTKADLTKTVEGIESFFGEERLKMAFPQYKQGTRYEEIISSFSSALWDCFDTTNPNFGFALDRLEGRNSVPIMTIHKSKGLEYHTVIFLGLEDSSFWTFANQQSEDTCAFFVAFSRAKESVLFTFTQSRTVNLKYPTQSKSAIKPLYDLLSEAGVPEKKFKQKQ